MLILKEPYNKIQQNRRSEKNKAPKGPPPVGRGAKLSSVNKMNGLDINNLPG